MNQRKLNNKEVEHYLQLFVMYVEAGRTPPPFLLEFMAEGARQRLANGTPWATKQGRKNAYQYVERRKRAVLIHALDSIGTNRARIAGIVGGENVSNDTILADIAQAEAMENDLNAGCFEYKSHLYDALQNQRLNKQERDAIKKLIQTMEDMENRDSE
jgi:hypothetical protein